MLYTVYSYLMYWHMYMTAGKQELHNFRLSQKRFIVYQPSKARHEEQAGGSSPPSSPGEPAGFLPGRLLRDATSTSQLSVGLILVV